MNIPVFVKLFLISHQTYIYKNAEPIKETRFMWNGKEDAIIYDPRLEIHYELKGYKKFKDGILREAKIVQL